MIFCIKPPIPADEVDGGERQLIPHPEEGHTDPHPSPNTCGTIAHLHCKPGSNFMLAETIAWTIALTKNGFKLTLVEGDRDTNVKSGEKTVTYTLSFTQW